MSLVRMVDVWRGSIVESMHFGVAAIANGRGEIIEGWGDHSLLTYPRSALKPVQAIALLESGAANAWNLGPQHVALACGSHRGESFHTRLAESWLASLDLNEDALACGADAPADPATALAAAQSGLPKRRVYNNCSGKHCGLLTVARHRDWAIEGYGQLSHPVQQMYLDALSELAARDAHAMPFGTDGCTLPAAALTVGEFAKLMARFADARATSSRRRSAMQGIHDAMRAHPEYVSGSKQPGVDIARVTKGRLVMKTGAEGFMAVYAPGQGLGLALKIVDGELRARVPALIAMLSATRLLNERELGELQHLAEPAVFDSAGSVVGRICGCASPAVLDA